MRHRLVTFLVLALGLLFLVPVVETHMASNDVWSGGIYRLSGSQGSALSSPGWTVMNLTCNGRIGRVVVYDDFRGIPVLNATVLGHGHFEVALPYAGDYTVMTVGNSSLICTDQVWGLHATHGVQEVAYAGSSSLILLSAVLLWRWSR